MVSVSNVKMGFQHTGQLSVVIELAKVPLNDKLNTSNVAQMLQDVLPYGSWSNYCNPIHLVFRGIGDVDSLSLLGQQSIEQVMRYVPHFVKVTLVTDGMHEVTSDFKKFVAQSDNDFLFSVECCLNHEYEFVVYPDVVGGYEYPHGQLIFIMDEDDFMWEKMAIAVDQFRNGGVDYPVWVKCRQKSINTEVLQRAISYGVNLALLGVDN